MKQKAALRRSTLKMIAKNLIVLVVLAVVAFAGVFSWFKAEPKSKSSSLDIKATAPKGLEFFIVAPNDSNTVQQGYSAINTWISNYNTTHGSETGFVAKGWHEGEFVFDFEDAELGFMSNLFLCETTGNGKTFTIPSLVQYGEIAYVDTEGEVNNATPNEEYMSFDIYFRSKTPNDVKLLYTSSIEPAGTPGTGSDEAIKNAAIGAVRLSVYYSNTRELLWIPGPHVWYDGTANNGEGQLYVNQTTYPTGRGNVYVSGNSYALYSERTTDHAYYNTSGTRVIEQNGTNNVVASTGTGDYEYKLGSSHTNDIPVCTLNNTYYDSSTGYYYNRVRVNLWIEGEDAESRLKFVGGKFSMTLNFDVND